MMPCFRCGSCRPGFARIVGILTLCATVFAAAQAAPAAAECRDVLLEAGIDDGFSPANMSEPATPSAGLLVLTGPNRADFDATSANLRFGQTLALAQEGCVVDARLELRAKPLASAPSGSENDAIHVGFVAEDGAFEGARGSAFFGSGNTPPPLALLADAWVPANYPDGRAFVLDLGNLPGGVDLLPDLEAKRRLDIYVQDDTSIDYVRAVVSLCDCPSPTPTRTPAPPVRGYADLHVHQFTSEGLGGAWLYGSATGPVATAVPRCNGNVPLAPGRNHGELDKARIIAIAGPVAGTLLGQLASESVGADTGLHAARRHGYCQAHLLPGPGLCKGNVACNLLGESSCTPTSVCEWKSLGTLCRDKPGDGISAGAFCNLVANQNCNNNCYFDWPLCRGNFACNKVSKANCKSSVCALESIGSGCRDRDGDGKSVGLACNTLGQSACAAACSWDANWGSIVLHAENRAHDWTDRHKHDQEKASWPAWDAIAHQQVHTMWLHQAYQDGLRLLVMSALNNESFCAFLPLANRPAGYDCSDLANVMRQLDAAIALGADPNTPWYQIAHSPAEARSIINANKLAVILSVEASDIFNGGDPLATLQDFYDKGVRTLQPLHQFNSKLGGVAWHEGMIKTVQTIKNLPSLHHLCKDNGGTGNYAKCDATKNQLNFLGLTLTGKRFVVRMLNLGMPVDIAHMSELSVKDVELIVTAACDYPVYVSHGHARTLLDEDSWKANKKHEKTVPDWELELIARTGGVFGLRTGSDHHESTAYHAAMAAAGIPTSLPVMPPESMPGGGRGGNEFHFAYALDYLFRLQGVHVALGSDLNGLIPQMVFYGEPQDAKMAGLAHIGKLPVMMSKVQATGLDPGTFAALKQNSAEAYLQMWERAADFAGGSSCCPTPEVALAQPDQAWYGRSNRITVYGSGFTPHRSFGVSVRPSAMAAPVIACTDVEFVSGSALRCTLPPLAADTWYQVTVSNEGCGLEASMTDAYFASAVDTGPVPDPEDPPFTQADLETALADVIPSNGWLMPDAEKIAAVDWTDPAWDGASAPSMDVPADRPFEDGYAQPDWDASRASPERMTIWPAVDVLVDREDAALMSDPLTMIAACGMEEDEIAELAIISGWPADWPAQLSSLCDWQSNVCMPGTFTCPGGAVVERVGQVTDATTAACPFDLAATYATCPGVPCTGDCDTTGGVTVDDEMAMVEVALGGTPVSACDAGDADRNGRITIDEIVAAVINDLGECSPGGESSASARAAAARHPNG